MIFFTYAHIQIFLMIKIKLRLWNSDNFTSEFESHWESHSFGFVPYLRKKSLVNYYIIKDFRPLMIRKYVNKPGFWRPLFWLCLSITKIDVGSEAYLFYFYKCDFP